MGFPKDKHPPSPSTVNLIKKKRANSSEHLASPTRAVSSPLGKGMTLSMAGSEAESIYGMSIYYFFGIPEYATHVCCT